MLSDEFIKEVADAIHEAGFGRFAVFPVTNNTPNKWPQSRADIALYLHPETEDGETGSSALGTIKGYIDFIDEGTGLYRPMFIITQIWTNSTYPQRVGEALLLASLTGLTHNGHWLELVRQRAEQLPEAKYKKSLERLVGPLDNPERLITTGIAFAIHRHRLDYDSPVISGLLSTGKLNGQTTWAGWYRTAGGGIHDIRYFDLVECDGDETYVEKIEGLSDADDMRLFEGTLEYYFSPEELISLATRLRDRGVTMSWKPVT